MLAEGLVRTDVRAGQDGLLQCGQLALQAGGQNGKAHDLDEADVLFFDMVQGRMRVEDAERMFRRCDVVAQDEVQLIVYAAAAGNGCDGVVRLAVRLGKDEGTRMPPLVYSPSVPSYHR